MTDEELHIRNLLDRLEFLPSCACGCGLMVPQPKRADRPRRYLPGHYRKDWTGMAFGPEWRSFHSAKNRCQNVRDPNYPGWGGRGIRFLLNSVSELIRAIGRRPSPNHSLDRIEVNGNYELGNVRWADPTTQANNRRPRNSEADELLPPMPY